MLVPLLVVAFLISGVGQGGSPEHDLSYRIGATAWAVAWLSGFVILLFSAFLLLYRAVRARRIRRAV